MWIRNTHTKKERILVISGIISLSILILISTGKFFQLKEFDREQKDAVEIMESLIDLISGYCLQEAISIDTIADPGKTGLIGPEWTPIVSTIGHLDAKRTTINPDFAALMVILLREANVEKGDTIALGCSGSFPGLLLASLSAAEAMGLNCKTILSLGASSYGATRPDLTILDIYQLLMKNNLVTVPPIAVSLGGELDRGYGWEKETINHLLDKIDKGKFRLILKSDIQSSVRMRVKLYDFKQSLNIGVFINAGGAIANTGSSESILGIKPGLHRSLSIPGEDQQGLIHKAVQNGIPVIHLLYIKGLVMEYGFPWDPLI